MCRGKTTFGICGKKDPDHPTNECNNSFKCANCEGDHLAYAKICGKKKKNLIIKHKQNIPYQEARKIMEAQYSKSSYASATKGNLEKKKTSKKNLRNANQKNSNYRP